MEGATETIPQGQILAIVARIEQVMVSVVSSTIDNWLQKCRHFEAAIVDRDGPDVDGNIQCQIQHLVQWEQECVNVVRHTLREAVDRVKRMTGVRRRHFPHVMRLVYRCVDETMVEATVDPVDEAVGEEDEGEYRQYNRQPTCTKHHSSIHCQMNFAEDQHSSHLFNCGCGDFFRFLGVV